MERPAVVLPQPDSPTRPSVSPGAMSNEMPSTARTAPLTRAKSPVLMGKCLVRLRTESSGAAASVMRVRPVLRRRAGACGVARRSGSAAEMTARRVRRVELVQRRMLACGSAPRRSCSGRGSGTRRASAWAGHGAGDHRAAARVARPTRGMARQQPLGVGVVRGARTRVDRRLLDHLAGVHHDHARRRSRRSRRGRA